MGEGAKTPPQSSLPVTLLQDVLDLPDGEHQPLLVTQLVEANVLQILHTDTQHLINSSVALKQYKFTIMLLFGSVRSSRSHNLRPSLSRAQNLHIMSLLGLS